MKRPDDIDRTTPRRHKICRRGVAVFTATAQQHRRQPATSARKQKASGCQASEGYKPKEVELEGIEPSSKQGNHTLSTRLFRPSVFVPPQDPDHQRRPYPLKLHHARGAGRDYSRFNRTAGSERFGTTASGRCLVLSPCDGIKPVIYYASIRQRERTCFRQINL